MTDFAFVGKKRTGKTKHAVHRMRDYLKRGCRVATNIDLDLVALFGTQSRKVYVRVPDLPSAFDLEAIGKGIDQGYDEDNFGALVLDELGVWFNARDFTDKGRAETLHWLVHSGKLCWDVYYLLHDVEQVDKQLRKSFFEFTVRHISWRKMKIPVLGWILNALFGGRVGYFPPYTTYTTRQGTDPTGMRTDGGMLAASELHKAYDTQQRFSADYPHGTHSVLSPWHVVGRHGAVALPWWRKVFAPAKKAAVVPLTRPSPAYQRVLELTRKLPPDQAAQLVARYARQASH